MRLESASCLSVPRGQGRMAVKGSQRVKDVAFVKWAPQPSPLLLHPYSGGEADDLSDAERLTMLLNGSQSAERR